MNSPLRTGLAGDYERAALQACVEGKRPCHIQDPPTSGLAWFAWSLTETFGRTSVWVTDGPRSLDSFYLALQALADGREDRLAIYPARESAPGGLGRNPDIAGDRLDVLRRVRSDRPPALIATCVQALLQTTLAPADLDRQRRTLALGERHDLPALAEQLAAIGYAFEPDVQRKGTASLRGGLLDVWPPDAAWPYRIEFFGSEIESMRTFDPFEQRSRDRVERVDLTPPAEDPGPAGAASLDAYVPPGTLWAWRDPGRIEEHALIFARSDPDGKEGAYAALRARLAALGGGDLRAVPPEETLPDTLDLGIEAVESLPAQPSTGGPMEPDLLERRRAAWIGGWMASASETRALYFILRTPGMRDRFLEQFGKQGRLPPHAEVSLGALEEGFRTADGRLTVFAEADLYGRQRTLRGRYDLHGRRPGPHAAAGGAPILDAASLQPGDLVVHADHGIGKYLGIYEIEFLGQKQEAMAIEYAEKAKLYVPVDQAHLLSRYMGLGRQRPELHRLGGARWGKEKQAAERAVQDLAAQLLRTQALRQTQPGIAYPEDGPWQREFEASFPYEETDDQLQAIEDVKRDMESSRAMDRLICGDVGYGKTEVAMRAAFKTVMGGKQVALLVPTTVLAQQHYDSFRERMAAFPIAIEMLSRFRTRGEQDEVVRALREGRVDIVIGTHRLVQPDVGFKDLGLVIIDEEQRFGVEHKERLKQWRANVDVLTLTATPIPRTLYMSLTGARDMSVIQTAPMERLPIETVVAPLDDGLVREAILRELNREGQVFYLHNRVQTIHAVRDHLVRLVPEARFRVAHGQMPERELASIMHEFVRGDFDVLLCTTIIESGVDIPNVNTILIDRADRFGLADLYQLRGRVGRYKHRAYAYLLLPKHGRLFDVARRRIGAIRKYSNLGAGFKLALQDLEMRGAGNLLGAAQSGHIAAVGFDLYCQLLQRTVAHLQGKPMAPVTTVRLQLDFIDPSPSGAPEHTAHIPQDYVEDEDHRLALYRRLAAADADALRALREECRDRFGPIAPALDRLFAMATLRLMAREAGLDAVETRGDRLLLLRGQEPFQFDDKLPRLVQPDARARLEEIMDWIRRDKRPPAAKPKRRA